VNYLRLAQFACLVTIGVFSLTGKADEAVLLKGKAIYEKQCAECHGSQGQGVEGEYEKTLTGDWPLEKLIRVVGKTMPELEPELCRGENARLVAGYVFETFWQKPEQFPQTREITLSRLTNRQFRQSVADLFAQFPGTRMPTAVNRDNRGLRATYYDVKKMNKRHQKKKERIDDRVDFDFGPNAPFEGMNKDGFSILWQGSILPVETGWYEFFVHSQNGFSFWINKDGKKASIDETVTGGKEREKSIRLFLLGGRPYPILLDFFKFKDPVAKVRLSWKPPNGKKEVIPREFLFQQSVPPSLIIQQKLPPDDSSYGFARGTMIEQAWDEAVTFAALEAGKYANEKIDKLAQTKQEDPRRKEKAEEFFLQFVKFAFRQPLTEKQKEFFVRSRFGESKSLARTVEEIVLITLKSPRFLYPEWQALAKKDKDVYVVATRLALYLWDSLPNERLHRLIEKGNLSKEGQQATLAKQMIEDPRAQAKFRDFLLHWLEINQNDPPKKDSDRFPKFDDQVVSDLRRSLIKYLDSVVWEDRGTLDDLLQAREIPLSKKLAGYYGIKNLRDSNRTAFPFYPSTDLGRVGLFTHPYLLANYSYTDQTSPIHRGVFVSRKILGRHLRPPKEAISFKSSDFDPNWTMRQKVTALTKPANCMACHDLINSTGFLLEGYDATGRVRGKAAGKTPDTKVTYFDREGNELSMSGPADLLTHSLRSESSKIFFIEELFKYVAKQDPSCYKALRSETLLKDMKTNKLTDVYLQLCFEAATDRFVYAP
jgi:hypothetical protein